MSKNRQSKNLNKRQDFSKKDIGGYYFDGKSLTRFILKKIDHICCKISNWCWKRLYAKRKK